MGADSGDTPGLSRPALVRVLESAARLQEAVPDAVLVGQNASTHRFVLLRSAGPRS